MNEHQATRLLLEVYASGVRADIRELGNHEYTVLTDSGVYLWCEEDWERYQAGTLLPEPKQERTA